MEIIRKKKLNPFANKFVLKIINFSTKKYKKTYNTLLITVVQICLELF